MLFVLVSEFMFNYVTSGVEIKFKNQHYPVMIAPNLVSELYETETLESGVVIGAATSLTNIEHLLKQLIDDQPGTVTMRDGNSR